MKKRIAAIISATIIVPAFAFAAFDINLKQGDRGAAVIELQNFLISRNLLAADSGTGYFGSLTRAAVVSFQIQNNISPASGFFGPLTRAAVRALAGGPPTYPSPNTPGASNDVAGLLALVQKLQLQIADILAARGSGGSCSFNGKSVAHGGSVNAFQSASVGAGQTCQKETRICSNGALSGSYQYASCASTVYSFNGGTQLGGQSDPTWKTVASRDFNGDGKADILWRHTTDGAVTVWFTKSDISGFNGSTSLTGTPAANWKAVAAGDFNGDGRADVLWHNDSTGAIYVWYTKSDLTGFVTTTLLTGTAAEAAWKPVAASDFNADGKADVLWYKSDGSVSVWLTKSDLTGFNGGSGLGGTADAHWTAVDAGDFNGDGRADVLWHSSAAGVAVWLTKSDLSGFVNSAPLSGTASANWTAKTAGDFNGDGRADVAWQHTNDSISIWFTRSDGTGYNASTGLDAKPETGWSVISSGDFNSDGRSDVLWYHVSGSASVWLIVPPVI